MFLLFRAVLFYQFEKTRYCVLCMTVRSRNLLLPLIHCYLMIGIIINICMSDNFNCEIAHVLVKVRLLSVVVQCRRSMKIMPVLIIIIITYISMHIGYLCCYVRPKKICLMPVTHQKSAPKTCTGF